MARAMERTLLKEVGRGRIGCICDLISEGVNVNCVNMEGKTALHLATELENEEFVNILIAAGANINKLTKQEESALDIALSRHNLKIVKILLEGGADINNSNEVGTTSLHLASFSNDVNLLKFLISHGANVNVQDGGGSTALHCALVENQGGSHLKIFETLLSNGADPNLKNSDGLTPLQLLVATDCSVEIIELFYKYKADFNAKNEQDATVLHSALTYEATEMVKQYQRFLNPDLPGLNNQPTADYKLRFKQSVKIIKCLVNNGADPTAKLFGQSPILLTVNTFIKFGKTFEHYKEDEVELISFLLKHTDVNAIHSDINKILSDTAVKPLEHVWKTILQHIAELKTQNLSVCQSLLKTISSNNDYKNYFTSYTEEFLNKNKFLTMS